VRGALPSTLGIGRGGAGSIPRGTLPPAPPADPSGPPPPASPRSGRRRFWPAGSGSATSVPPGVWDTGGGGSPVEVSRIGEPGGPPGITGDAGPGARRPDGPTASGAKPAEVTITPGCAGGTAVAGGAAPGAETGGAKDGVAAFGPDGATDGVAAFGPASAGGGGTAGAVIVGAVPSDTAGPADPAAFGPTSAGGGGTAGAVIVGAVPSDTAGPADPAAFGPAGAGGGGTAGVDTVGAVPSAAAEPADAGVVPGGGGFVVPARRAGAAGWPVLRGGSWTPVAGALRARRGGSGGSRRPHD